MNPATIIPKATRLSTAISLPRTAAIQFFGKRLLQQNSRRNPAPGQKCSVPIDHRPFGVMDHLGTQLRRLFSDRIVGNGTQEHDPSSSKA